MSIKADITCCVFFEHCKNYHIPSHHVARAVPHDGGVEVVHVGVVLAQPIRGEYLHSPPITAHLALLRLDPVVPHHHAQRRVQGQARRLLPGLGRGPSVQSCKLCLTTESYNTRASQTGGFKDLCFVNKNPPFRQRQLV